MTSLVGSKKGLFRDSLKSLVCCFFGFPMFSWSVHGCSVLFQWFGAPAHEDNRKHQADHEFPTFPNIAVIGLVFSLHTHQFTE